MKIVVTLAKDTFLAIQMKNRFLFLIISSWFSILLSCSSPTHIIRYEDKFVSVDSTIKPDSAMTAELAPYKMQLSKIMDEVLAYSEKAMMKDQPEGLLGDFAAEAVFKKSKEYCKDSCNVDFCLLNNGGLRNPLPKGNITRGNIFQLMPQQDEFSIEKDFFPKLVGKSFYGFEVKGEFVDIGVPERYAQVKQKLKKKE